MEHRGPIYLVEHKGELYLLREVLADNGASSGFIEFAVSGGSGMPVAWRPAACGDYSGMEPLSSARLCALDRPDLPDMPADLLETRSAFARRCGVDGSRVYQWIKSGQIGRDALNGRGSYSRIRVLLALSQLRERRGRGWRKRAK